MRKFIYQILMSISGMVAGKKAIINKTQIPPVQLPYVINITLNNGDKINLSDFKGKKIMVVNIASGCGFTPQLTELETLYKKYKDKLVILAFPANNFGHQEPKNDQAIQQFCSIQYPCSFYIAQKGDVIGANRHPMYVWLTQKNLNGWNTKAPSWNFCKYLLGEDGKLIGFYPPSVSPLDKRILQQL